MKKTYSERYKETTALSQNKRDALRKERVSKGKDVGVIDRVNADKADLAAWYRKNR